MKKTWRRWLLTVPGLLLLFHGCAPNLEPPEDTEPFTPVEIVAIGDSITMGSQDAGLVEEFQKNNYPYIIAKQMGQASYFKQPYVKSPGIGSFPYKEPLELEDNQIIAVYWPDTTGDGIPDPPSEAVLIADLSGLLKNLFWPKPYNNLGVNGAQLFDMRSTTTATDSLTGDNFFFDVVLRNFDYPLVPDFGDTTVVEQAAMLEPELILLWIGNNDILKTVLKGAGTDGSGFTELDTMPTDPGDFEDEYTLLLTDLTAICDQIVMANIPSYLPFGYALDGVFVTDGYFPTGRLRLFDPETFEPVDFDPDPDPAATLYIPFLLEEVDAEHLVLTGAIAYLESGAGIPDEDDLTDMAIDPADAAVMRAAMETAGIYPTGDTIALTGDLTMTAAEVTAVLGFIADYNAVLETLSANSLVTFGVHVPLVDVVESWWSATIPTPFGGYSGDHPIQDEDSATFSLDGVHPNNLGHALCARAFIEVLNAEYDLGIPELTDLSPYQGQYAGKSIDSKSLRAIKAMRQILDP